MNIENIFILRNVIWERSRRRFGSVFIKIPKVTSAQSSLLDTQSDPFVYRKPSAFKNLCLFIFTKNLCLCRYENMSCQANQLVTNSGTLRPINPLIEARLPQYQQIVKLLNVSQTCTTQMLELMPFSLPPQSMTSSIAYHSTSRDWPLCSLCSRGSGMTYLA